MDDTPSGEPSELAAWVAHETRSSLTSLALALAVCLEGRAGPLTEVQARLLRAAGEDCERLRQAVDQVLALLRAATLAPASAAGGSSAPAPWTSWDPKP
jgi:signal transduction histidine kinase